MLRFVHSADWQLGSRFSQFGGKSDFLRAARFQTLQRAMMEADTRHADAFLIAGDLFEDGQVEESVIEKALEVFGRFPNVPVYILPGNHDPNTGLGSIWHRRPFSSRSSNVHLLLEPGLVSLGEATLAVSPLRQKVSIHDPSLKLADLVKGWDGIGPLIGMTHGSPAVPSQHKENDFPIALNAATRAGLDYLALGHWHNWLALDQERMIMPGTPEPDRFDQNGAGTVTWVELKEQGSKPKVEQLPVATLQWHALELDFSYLESDQEKLEGRLNEWKAIAHSCVVRVTFRGSVSPAHLEEVRQHFEPLFQSFPLFQLVDKTSVMFSETEFKRLQAQHPILAQVVSDLARLERLITNAPLPPACENSDFTFEQVQELLENAKIDVSALDERFFTVARRLLNSKLQEAAL